MTGLRGMRGVGLLQALAVVAVVAIVVGVVLARSQQKDAGISRAQWVDGEARDLARLHKALMRYRDEHRDTLVATWGAQAHAAPGRHALMTTGEPNYLPDGFAGRGGHSFTSPWLQRYRLLGALLKRGDAHYPAWVVYEAGAMNPARLQQIGVGPGQVAALKRDIVALATTKYHVPAALIAAGTADAVGYGKAWSKDLASDFHGAFVTAPQARAAVLVGYPGLEGEPIDMPDGPKWIKVHLELASDRAYDPNRSGQCAVYFGEEAIVSWPVCATAGHGYEGHSVYSSDLGAITITAPRKTTSVTLYRGRHEPSLACQSEHDPSNMPPDCYLDEVTKTNTVITSNLFLNESFLGAEMSSCWSSSFSQGHWEGARCRAGLPTFESGQSACIRYWSGPSWSFRRDRGLPAEPIPPVNRLCGTRVE